VGARPSRAGTKLNVCYPVIGARHLAVREGPDGAIVIANQNAALCRSALCLVAPDEHVRKHWIDSLHQVRGLTNQACSTPVKLKRKEVGNFF